MNFLWFFSPFIFGFPIETCRSLLLHAVCSEVHWAAQIRARCVDVGLRTESGSASNCRDPAGSSPDKPQFSGVYCFLLTTTVLFLCGVHCTTGKLISFDFMFFTCTKKSLWFYFLDFSQLQPCCMSQSEKALFILSHKSMSINLPHTVIWTAAVGKVHQLFLTHSFQHHRVFAKTVLIIIMSSAYSLSDDVCYTIW